MKAHESQMKAYKEKMANLEKQLDIDRLIQAQGQKKKSKWLKISILIVYSKLKIEPYLEKI